MIPRELRYQLDGAWHRLAWVEWGDPAAAALICVHGLTRNGRDFDPLAARLADRYRVVCPDLPGRGRSDWLRPDQYLTASYMVALSHLLARVGPAGWLGTSLGGICGMLLAGPHTPITRLILNDVGPAIPAAALARIRDYMAVSPDFADIDGLEAHLRRVHAPFGALTDAQWRHLAIHSARPAPDGGLALHYDPAIARPILEATPADVDLWPVWSAITIPVLAIRGADSDLLQAATLERMRADGAMIHTIQGAGHAPALMDTQAASLVAGFLAG